MLAGSFPHFHSHHWLQIHAVLELAVSPNNNGTVDDSNEVYKESERGNVEHAMGVWLGTRNVKCKRNYIKELQTV